MTDKPIIRFLDRTTPPHIATLVLMTGLSAMAMNIYLPALPAMTEHFGTTYSVMQLSVAVFMAVNAAAQLLIGPLSDRYGRRPVLLGGILIFLIATVAAIYAPTVETFLAMRAAQAAIVVVLVLSRAIVRDIFSGNSAASMIAYVTMGMALIPMFAPSVGGLLTIHFGWQSTFWLLFAYGIGVGALIFFDNGETAPTSTVSLLKQFRAYPELLSSQRFWGYSLATTFGAGAFFAYLGGAPFIGGVIFDLPEGKLGLYMAAPGFGYFIGNFLSGRYSLTVGMNRLVLLGGLTTVAGSGGSLIFFLTGHATAESFFGFMVFLGLGNGLQIPNATAGALSVRPHLAGSASGLNGAMMIGGGAALSALAGSFLSEELGAAPPLIIMTGAAFCSMLSILWVIRRAKVIGFS